MTSQTSIKYLYAWKISLIVDQHFIESSNMNQLLKRVGVLFLPYQAILCEFSKVF